MNSGQLKKFWACVGDISRQVDLVINGKPCKADPESWRLVFCAGLKGENRIADGINGEKVVLGLRLRDIFAGLDDETREHVASDLITLVRAFGDEHGVQWSDPAQIQSIPPALQHEYEGRN